VIYPRNSFAARAERAFHWVNYSLAAIIVTGLITLAFQVADAFLSGRVAEILGGAR
jgi:hypothetical protein